MLIYCLAILVWHSCITVRSGEFPFDSPDDFKGEKGEFIKLVDLSSKADEFVLWHNIERAAVPASNMQKLVGPY